MALAPAYAKFDQILFFVDAPEVVALDMGGKNKIIAVASNNVSDYAFLAQR